MGNITEILLIRKERLSEEAYRESLLKPFVDLLVDLNTKKVKMKLDSIPTDLINTFIIGKFHLSFKLASSPNLHIYIGVTEEKPFQLVYRFLNSGSNLFAKDSTKLMKQLLELIEPYLIIPEDEARKDVTDAK